MTKYIRQFFLLLFCLIVASCSSENELNEIPDVPPPIPVDTGLTVIQKPQVDVLVVLDNSCSMMEDWSYITYGMARIPEELNENNFDWKLGLVSMDPGDAIFMSLDPTVPDPGWDMITLVADFKLVAGQVEAAFDSAIAKRSRNEAWFRPGVTTLVVFISDEHEQSVIEPGEFRSLWPSQLVVASVVGPEILSQGESSCAEVAVDFHVVSQIVVDICTTERWSVIEPLLQ
jgi:hypothetical protein